MFRYVDKTFFKFLLGFIAIIAVSCMAIIAARVYEAAGSAQTEARVLKSVK